MHLRTLRTVLALAALLVLILPFNTAHAALTVEPPTGSPANTADTTTPTDAPAAQEGAVENAETTTTSPASPANSTPRAVATDENAPPRKNNNKLILFLVGYSIVADIAIWVYVMRKKREQRAKNASLSGLPPAVAAQLGATTPKTKEDK